MFEQIKFDFCILPGAPGWASVSVRVGDRTMAIGRFSQALTDGLDDFVRATLTIVCGSWEESFSMDDEPEPRWQWLLKREMRGYGDDHRAELDVTITRFDAWDATTSDEVFRATCDPDEFGRAALSAVQRVMASEPRAELIGRWSSFPVRAAAALEAALAIPRDKAIL